MLGVRNVRDVSGHRPQRGDKGATPLDVRQPLVVVACIAFFP